MTKLYGWETLFYGTVVAYTSVGPIGSLQGLNRSVKGIASMLLILLTLLYYVYLRPMIISTPELDLILSIAVRPIKLHWTLGPLVHFLA